MRRLVIAALLKARRAASRVWRPWREFWFKPADPTPLAVMRILFGGMLLYTHFVWGLNLDGFFGPNGWQGDTLVRTVQEGQLAWSFWWWVPNGLRLTVHLVSLGILALYMLGAMTRVTSVLAYVITVSYAYRAPLANFGLDQINAIAALYLAIGPSGAVLSVDRLWRRYRTARSSLLAGITPLVPPVRRSARANFALRLMQVHLCVIYIFACQSKLQGESWWNGQAIWQAVSNLEYQSVDLTWLAWYPWLVNLLTHATIVWEMTFWALVWRPLCRPIVLLIGVAIHLGIGAFMGMWTFGLAMIFLYVAFVPATTLNAVLGAIAGAFRKIARPIGLDPARFTNPRLKALSEALRFEEPVDDAETLPAAIASPPDIVAPAAVGPSTVAETHDHLLAETAEETPSEGNALPTIEKTLDPSDGRSAKKGDRAKVSDRVASNGRRPLAGIRPVLVLVESRLKRQTQIQEYLVKRGFRCFVASELHQARSLLSVVDVDALVVTSTWFSDDDVGAFREALISGGPSLPASLIFVTAANRSYAERLEDHERHRLIRSPVSLRELRLLILDVLGLADPPPPPSTSRSHHSPNGNGHKPAPPTSPSSAAGPMAESASDLEVGSIESGAQT
ncbi:MAG TPA: HTTM domain-containing protein [Planctomycetaceae bacterium]|jgi:hypothetical protein|nr:HTTM domain-containing protein [Planctomycetaceae bacterium]